MSAYAWVCVVMRGHPWASLGMRGGVCLSTFLCDHMQSHAYVCVGMRRCASGSGSWMGLSRMRRGVQGRVRVGGHGMGYGAWHACMRV